MDNEKDLVLTDSEIIHKDQETSKGLNLETLRKKS